MQRLGTMSLHNSNHGTHSAIRCLGALVRLLFSELDSPLIKEFLKVIINEYTYTREVIVAMWNSLH